jgi:S-DNA-T family DNA segregation ATPase FtsK/SpoIIIE
VEAVPVAEAPDYDTEVPDSGRGRAFDHLTDQQTSAIAERFKPEKGTASEPAAGRREPELPGPLAFLEHPEPQLDTTHVPQLRRSGGPYQRPPLSMLKRPPASKTGAEPTPAELRGQAQLLASVLGDFGVRGEVKNVHPGPVVTLFEFEPARGVKSARVIGLSDDIARSLGAASVRAAIVPGRNAIGIELPNMRREKVNLRQLFESEQFRASDASLPLVLGRDIAGRTRARRPGAHAASARCRHDGRRQVGRRQRHDPVAALQALAR